MSFGDPIVFLIGSVFLIPAILVAVPVHELGHAVAAVLAGDPSPRNRGYLRLGSPRRYYNVYGVLAAFLANVTWGNPVPVNEYRLASAGRKLVFVLGGPAASLLVAVVFGVLLRLVEATGGFPNVATFVQPPLGYLATIVYAIYFLNLATFAFQLLPVPGLDGWRVVETLFRSRNPRFFFTVAANTQTIWMVALFVILLGPLLLRFSILNAVVGIFFQPASSAILGTCASYVVLDPCPLR
ncbi:MAG TPA: site-2 protease family protein [Candidatus Dormibacteraeota bacterium]|nr:site-2 protease family protein [Candidatus Dormibacteraeota bacterium]